MALSSTSSMANLKDATTAFKSENWTVLKSSDPMSDKVQCTGIYKDNYKIQLTENGLYISVSGGMRSVTLRFDDKPAHSGREATKGEDDVGAIVITGEDFSELINSERLRTQVLTRVKGMDYQDIDLKGIKPALENILAGCPTQQISEKVSSPSSATIAKESTTSICTNEIKVKMKANGVKEKQIQNICKP